MKLDPVYVIEVDLLCDKQKPAEHPTPTYRIYMDNDMLAEQTYTWDNSSNYIRLRCEVRLDKGKHRLNIVDLTSKGTAIYSFRNPTVDKQPLVMDESGNFQIT